MQATQQTTKQQIDENKKAGFQKWMASASTRLLMSQITCGDQTQSDTMQVLFRDAFENGFAYGGAALGIEMLTTMINKKSD